MRLVSLTTGLSWSYNLEKASEPKPYLSANVDFSLVDDYLFRLNKILGEKKYQKYVEKQKERDAGCHHMTILNPYEYEAVADKEVLDNFYKMPVVVKMIGIGRAVDGGNESFFVVCDCPDAGAIRNYLGLPKQDFHVTLGFKEQDIFDKPKDESALIFPYNLLM